MLRLVQTWMSMIIEVMFVYELHIIWFCFILSIIFLGSRLQRWINQKGGNINNDGFPRKNSSTKRIVGNSNVCRKKLSRCLSGIYSNCAKSIGIGINNDYFRIIFRLSTFQYQTQSHWITLVAMQTVLRQRNVHVPKATHRISKHQLVQKC